MVVLSSVSWAKQGFETTWDTLRQEQPYGLSLQLKLPRTNFFQGEMIPATLVFKNLSTNQYHLQTDISDRSGRCCDISFTAASESGQLVVDPLERFQTLVPQIYGGLSSGDTNLKDWTVTLPANQWLRFDSPGIYRIYASSSLPIPGEANSTGSVYLHEIVSDVMTIRITPLEPAQEQKITAEAKEGLLGDKDTRSRAIETLRYLQTSGARRALIPFIANNPEVSLAFLSSPTPNDDSQAILQAALKPDFVVNDSVVSLYADLKALSLQYTNDRRANTKEFRKATTNFQKEFVASFSSGVTNKNRETLLPTTLALLKYAPQDSQLRQQIVSHRNELTSAQLWMILENWNEIGGKDFLPIIQPLALSSKADLRALAALAKMVPDEAKGMILQDFSNEQSVYIKRGEMRQLCEIVSVLQIPTQEMDNLLRKKLHQQPPDYMAMPLIAEFASTNLQSDVADFYYKKEGHWACAIQNDALRYLIRCNRKERLSALSRALKMRQATGCYKDTLVKVLLMHWVDEALPLVLESLKDEDAEVVTSAIHVLERNAPSEVMAQVIPAIERVFKTSGVNGKSQQKYAISMIYILLDSKRWKLNEQQTRRLEALLANLDCQRSCTNNA